ncbi:MAG: ABC transporter permease [Burkholderiaceae bacterium]|nr:ABC transporter permease [Burkholderiaceae bacterium]
MSYRVPALDRSAIPDGIRLKSSLRRADLMGRVKAYALIAPLLLFLLMSFLAPIGAVLSNSVDNGPLPDLMPETAAQLAAWDPAVSELPPDPVFAAFANELRANQASGDVGKIATRLNYDTPGMRALIVATARTIGRLDVPVSREALLAMDQRWGSGETWTALRRASGNITPDHYLSALDLRRSADGAIERQPPDLRLYRDVALRTLWISALVAGCCLLLGYPLAHLLASLPSRASNLLMILVLLPFWTSLLVRTVAWVVILQTQGLFNDLLIYLGLIDQRIQLIFNRFGVVVAMVHILLPYMVLSLYSVMKGISPNYVRASRSLGASPLVTFVRVYLPLSMPGVFAGVLLVYILALGFYVTPAIVGGPNDQMLSFFIADHVNNSLNWSLAAALGVVLLAAVLVLYFVYARLVRRTSG